MTLRLSINGYQTRVSTIVELQRELDRVAHETSREIWIEVEAGPALCGLINCGSGWLMYLREAGDAGLSSRNPDYVGKSDTMLEYRLSNGQHDIYPASWALPESRVIQALRYFFEYLQPAPFIQWHDDSA